MNFVFSGSSVVGEIFPQAFSINSIFQISNGVSQLCQPSNFSDGPLAKEVVGSQRTKQGHLILVPKSLAPNLLPAWLKGPFLIALNNSPSR